MKLLPFGIPLVLLSLAVASPSQQHAAPIQQMPFSPVLDLTSLDRTVDPCNDFYAFSCGGWKKNNPIPADQASWSVYGKLTDENQQFLWGILETDSKLKNRNAIQQKVGDAFGACMDTERINKRGIDPLRPELASIAAIKDRAALDRAIDRLDREAQGTFFSNAGGDQDPSDSNSVIATVGAGGLGLPDRDYYTKTDKRSVEIRAKYVEYISQLFTLAGEPAAQAATDAADVLRIETALANASLTRVERRDPYKSFHKMSVADLTALNPSIDWKAFFVARGHANLATVNVEQPVFQKAVDTELKTEPLEALKSYLRFHLLTAAAPSLSAPFETASFEFFSHYLRGTQQPPPRWKRCVRTVDRTLGEALGQEFVARTFAAETKAKTLIMTQQIETVMGDEIEHLDWMSPETKKEALRKLHAVRNKIGYPDTWRDYSSLTIQPGDFFGNTLRSTIFESRRNWAKIGKPVDRNEWGMTPPTVNAYFNPQMNDINFPSGVLQPPLYDPKADDAPNYGNTGSTIGHELTHAFDDEGRQFNAEGNLKDWWTKEDAKGFEDRINCLRDQFATYTIVDDIHINSKLTSGEDVADLGGTLIAYIAWKHQIENQRLKPLDGFTPDQRFFIGFAQWACENDREANLRVSAITNPHSPGFARINGIVTNMPDFATAFGCKVGQPMVKANVCKVW
ncbi:endothelin-converting enzyme Metallo peptidase. MEROPS family M13 [Granulicella pectinivorans]|uniref:Endothelin-converting enzyme Metallo peptidase. MEROPS family M13 n=1 Tax=Granulicella pectinivorans TaxID=474950 RepID=A0A1I6MIY7_9BACT|nr:M13 family metallopeptidase [Granulicella pectinivorans]SFS15686.1 endothelin-converting enzyme Metallo peptidase. MEROPS family M13 [Granulicella pectinivorans]